VKEKDPTAPVSAIQLSPRQNKLKKEKTELEIFLVLFYFIFFFFSFLFVGEEKIRQTNL
jgi:hypothetical protein